MVYYIIGRQPIPHGGADDSEQQCPLCSVLGTGGKRAFDREATWQRDRMTGVCNARASCSRMR